LPRHWRFLSQYKVSRTVLYNVDPDISASEPIKPLQSGFSLGLDYDDTDDYFFPTRGARLGTLVERQGGWFAGDVNLNRASARVTGYWTPFASVVGAATFGGGVVRQFAPSESVPIYERWFLGGATTVRGYREREIGEKDNLGNPLGGNVFTRGGVEVRFPLFWRVGGAFFLDGGMLNARERLVWPALWEWGAGPGLRLRTPIGPVRFDAGWKVRPAPGVARWVLHFSLGEAF
jgi:outer membrane protein insertion porin family